MKNVKILSVCGSGTVTSTMVAEKLKEHLLDEGYKVEATEARPTEALSMAQAGSYDVIVHTSPLPEGEYGAPIIDAFACMTGIGEDQFYADVVAALQEAGK